MSNYISKINRLVSKPEILAQIAEECSELGHAALKLRRTMITDNPTPVTFQCALDMFKEEAADLLLCFAIIDEGMRILPDEEELKRRKTAKAKRWVQRLEGKSEQEET